LLLLDGLLILHLDQLLLSILDDIEYLSIFNLLLHLLCLFFRFLIDSFNPLFLLLYDVFRLFTETVAGTLQSVALFWSEELGGVDQVRHLAFFVLDTCGHPLKFFLLVIGVLFIMVAGLSLELSLNELILNIFLSNVPEVGNMGKR
jgi:hypothetical protein